MDAATKCITVLQERFPNVIVKWETPPDPIFETRTCVLMFSPKSDQETIYPVEFPNGIGNDPIEATIEIIIKVHGDQLDSL